MQPLPGCRRTFIEEHALFSGASQDREVKVVEVGWDQRLVHSSNGVQDAAERLTSLFENTNAPFVLPIACATLVPCEP